MDTNTTRDAANPMITAYRGRLQYRKPLPPPPPSRGSSTRSTLTAVSAGDEEEEAERIRRKPAPVYMDHGLIPVYDVDTEGTYPEAHNYADGNWLVPGAPPPGQGLELSPSWNPGLEVIRNGSAEWILRARAVSDDGLPERLKDDAGLEVTGGGEGEDPAAAPKAIRRRKKWIIIGIVLFLVIAGAVGGAVGGVMAKKARSDSQTSEVDKTKPDEADTKSGNVSISSRSIQATDRVASAVFMDWTSNNSTNTMLWLRGTHMFYQTSDGWIRWKVFNETSYNNGIGKESWGSEEGMIINEIKARPSSAIAVTPTVYYGEFLDGDLQRYSRRAVEKLYLFYFDENNYVANLEFKFATGKWYQGVASAQKKAAAPSSGIAAGWCPSHTARISFHDSGMVFFQNKATGKIDFLLQSGLASAKDTTAITSLKFNRAFTVPTSGLQGENITTNTWGYDLPLHGTDLAWTMTADTQNNLSVAYSFLGRLVYQMPDGKLQATVFNLTRLELEVFYEADFGKELKVTNAVTAIESVGSALINTSIAIGQHDERNWRVIMGQNLSPISVNKVQLSESGPPVYNTTIPGYTNPQGTVYALSKPDTISTFIMEDIKKTTEVGGQWKSMGGLFSQEGLTSIAVEGESLFVMSGNITKVEWYEDYGQWTERPSMPIP